MKPLLEIFAALAGLGFLVALMGTDHGKESECVNTINHNPCVWMVHP